MHNALCLSSLVMTMASSCATHCHVDFAFRRSFAEEAGLHEAKDGKTRQLFKNENKCGMSHWKGCGWVFGMTLNKTNLTRGASRRGIV